MHRQWKRWKSRKGAAVWGGQERRRQKIIHTYIHTFASQSRKPENPPKKTVGPTEDILDMHTDTHSRTYKAPKG